MPGGSSYGSTCADGEFLDFDEVESVEFEHRNGRPVVLVCHMLSGRDHRIEGDAGDLVRLRDGIFRRQGGSRERARRLAATLSPAPSPTIRETIEEARRNLAAGKIASADVLLARALRRLP